MVVHLIALVNLWYYRFFWLDILMHFAGGAWLIMFLFWFFKKQQDDYLLAAPYGISMILALGFVALAGVGWEFFEFLFDVFISSQGYARVAQLGMADTMSDLLFDLLGGLTAWAIIIAQAGNHPAPEDRS